MIALDHYEDPLAKGLRLPFGLTPGTLQHQQGAVLPYR